MTTLSREDIIRMQAEGWQFPQTGLRVGNGWLVMTYHPKRDEHGVEVISDPDDEPDKWPGPQPGEQLRLEFA